MSKDPNAHSRAIEAAHKVMVGFGPPKRGITITEDTIKAMQKDRAELLAENEKLSDLWSQMKAERDALKADAERYRWLRLTTNFVTSSAGEKIDVRNCPDEWDAAIDAAMKRTS